MTVERENNYKHFRPNKRRSGYRDACCLFDVHYNEAQAFSRAIALFCANDWRLCDWES